MRGLAVRDGGRRHPYHLLSAAAKERYAVNRLRPSSLRCPDCHVGVLPQELLTHQEERCTGRDEPGPRDEWITIMEATRLGVTRPTLTGWARRGLVRLRDDGRYLMRDVVYEIALRRRRPWIRRRT